MARYRSSCASASTVAVAVRLARWSATLPDVKAEAIARMPMLSISRAMTSSTIPKPASSLRSASIRSRGRGEAEAVLGPVHGVHEGECLPAPQGHGVVAGGERAACDPDPYG